MINTRFIWRVLAALTNSSIFRVDTRGWKERHTIECDKAHSLGAYHRAELRLAPFKIDPRVSSSAQFTLSVDDVEVRGNLCVLRNYL